MVELSQNKDFLAVTVKIININYQAKYAHDKVIFRD